MSLGLVRFFALAAVLEINPLAAIARALAGRIREETQIPRIYLRLTWLNNEPTMRPLRFRTQSVAASVGPRKNPATLTRELSVWN